MKNQTRFITEVAIFSACGFVLDFVCGLLFGFAWLNGGSISIAMVPIFIMGFRWGIKGGVLTGLVVAIAQIIIPNMASMGGGPIQVFLDYIFAFSVVGVVGIIANKLPKMEKKKQIIYASILMFVVGIIRTFAHVISGTVFWGTTFWGSIVYNAFYMLPSIILCIIIVDVLIYTEPMLIFKDENNYI